MSGAAIGAAISIILIERCPHDLGGEKKLFCTNCRNIREGYLIINNLPILINNK
jgi:hypothetical protein